MSNEVKPTSDPPQAVADQVTDGAPLTAASELPAKVELTDEQLEELKGKAAKADEYWDRLLRTTADFDNFKRRSAKERQEAVQYANEALLKKLVTVVDTFEMALAAVNAAPGADAVKTGVAMIYGQLRSALTEAGLEEIDALSQTFDPNLHEAVAQQETMDAPEGQVVEQKRKGYRLRGRLLRPASVVVAKQPNR